MSPCWFLSLRVLQFFLNVSDLSRIVFCVFLGSCICNEIVIERWWFNCIFSFFLTVLFLVCSLWILGLLRALSSRRIRFDFIRVSAVCRVDFGSLEMFFLWHCSFFLSLVCWLEPRARASLWFQSISAPNPIKSKESNNLVWGDWCNRFVLHLGVGLIYENNWVKRGYMMTTVNYLSKELVCLFLCWVRLKFLIWKVHCNVWLLCHFYTCTCCLVYAYFRTGHNHLQPCCVLNVAFLIARNFLRKFRSL